MRRPNGLAFFLSGITQPFYFLRKAVHPLAHFLRKVGGRGEALFNGHASDPGDKVVGMRYDLLFNRPGHAVAGVEAESNALFCREAGAEVALDRKSVV